MKWREGRAGREDFYSPSSILERLRTPISQEADEKMSKDAIRLEADTAHPTMVV
jgi:hypothetical protein